MYKNDNHSAVENLSPELLMHILLLLGDPLYMSHLARTSKTLQKKLMNANQRMYWFKLYQRDFAKNPKPLSPEKEAAYKNLYIKSLEDWRTNSHLSKKHQKLFRSIRADDLPSIEQQTYDLSSKNDFIDVFDQEDNAVSLASRYKRDDILAYFYEQMCTHVFSKSKQDNKGRTKLYWATACNRFSEVNMLISEDVNKTQNNILLQLYSALLYIAAQYGHLEIVETLFNKGADVNKATPSGSTALYIAAYNGHVEVVKALLAVRADVDKPGDGATPLYIAAQVGRLEVVKTLLAAGADVNKPCTRRATPLYIAAQNGHLEVVKTLLTAEADVDKAMLSDTTSLHIAGQNGHQKIYSFLKFWKTKNLYKETSLLKQVILFLEISIQEKSFFDTFKTSLFSKKDDLYILINKLKKGELGLNKKDLKLILEENRNCIPLEKYEFILRCILADDPPSNPVSQMEY